MRFKTVVISVLFIALLTMPFMIPMAWSSPSPERGPHADHLRIVNYGSSYKEAKALGTGEIDITDWPLSKTFIDEFATRPEEITLRDYAEIGSFEIDINNQRWPTGVGDRPEDVMTYDPETDSYKHYFDETNEWDLRAWMFRLAIAHLQDRPYIRTEILKGYGNMMDTFIPVPSGAGWLDMGNLTASSFVTPYGGITIPSLIYEYDKDKAKAILDAAGFTVGPDGIRRVDPRKVPEDPGYPYLDPLIFYIRLDDPNREAMGLKMAKELEDIGVPADARDVEKTVCFKSVMVEYNYHLYTGGYSFGPDVPESLYGLFDSSQYWAPTGWSGGYQGFCHELHDYYTTNFCHKGATREEVLVGSHNATYLENKYVASIPGWCSAGVQGYRTGWEGVVNVDGYGISAPTGTYIWSLVNMRHPTKDTINWGFKSNLEGPSVITAEWVWDWQVLGEVYDSLITRNPYNLPEEVPLLATAWDVGTWLYGGDTEATVVTFTLREDAYFHDGTQVTPEDIAFSLEFTRDCGSGVAWNWASIKELDHVEVFDDRPAGGWGVKVYFIAVMYWALHNSGFLPMLKKDIWMAANDAMGWGYVWPHAPGPFYGWDQMKVREYHPWEDNYYRPEEGKVDLIEDGSGPWVFVDAELMEWVELDANRDYFLTQEWVENKIKEWFHGVGDVNEDGKISIVDMSLIARALGTTPTTGGIPGDWDAWNEAADLNKDDKVGLIDLMVAGKNFGKVAG